MNINDFKVQFQTVIFTTHKCRFSLGYPEDEAASLEAFIYRQKNAGDLFVGYFEDSKLYGVCIFFLELIMC